jgi:cell division protein FtsX
MDPSFAALVSESEFKSLLAVVLFVALAASCITLAVVLFVSPTAADAKRQAERQAIMEKLTPREMEILGVQ